MQHWSREVEVAVILRAKDGDKDAQAELIQHNQGMIRKIALREIKTHPNAELEDLAQAGAMGILKAIEGFNTKLGFRFMTYAAYWIRQYMQKEYPSTTIIHVPAKTIYADSAFRARVTKSLSRLMEDEFLQFEAKCDYSDIDEDDDKILLWKNVMRLPNKLRRCLVQRFKLGWTLTKIGESMGISKERARQILVVAQRRLKEQVTGKRIRTDQRKKVKCCKCQRVMRRNRGEVDKAKLTGRRFFCTSCRPIKKLATA